MDKSKVKKNENVKKNSKSKKLTKKQLIVFIIVFVSSLLIVYIAFLGMNNRPVEHLDSSEALSVLKEIYGSTWNLDDNGEIYYLSTRGQIFKKVEITKDFDRENLRIPFYLYLENEEEVLGRQVAILYYDDKDTVLKAKLPNSEIYDFAYSKSLDNKLESIAFISKENERTYFIRDLIK
ncbi:MAG: hypothetical protein ACPKM0_03605 [Pleomorphochaeta sp.]